ncbi:hypothetical protein AB32_1641 [Escherichia coli 2-316-03_S1_C2]|nr:hypothetical protein CE10_1523 [Escherichia coli O7:K1 str. CE10]EFJ74761.1 hypothetical protein HMPREF9552_01576 [Escherichia coli MS 198-1]ESD80776.1 hypothetical protein HMPREF1612_05323 [Escherichia coli 908585]KDX26920.1 hypothetical protein AB41_3851 [Escherichia coli 1-250-04_S1_C2]KDY10947.1 hypothetical protein AC72_2138 [Escherichia coli 2-316-03_S4_C1]KEJ30334.1 hypothetical protein AB32_1641 [Escherichia coli 2-316-03_S1_C2]KEL74667.1 hypothetical protein AC52_2402 [Escherichia
MMGTGSGAKQVNGEHSTRGNKKLTVAISPLAGFSAPELPEHNGTSIISML